MPAFHWYKQYPTSAGYVRVGVLRPLRAKEYVDVLLTDARVKGNGVGAWIRVRTEFRGSLLRH